MTEQAFEWRLTASERRIAEVAFAAEHAHASMDVRAIAAVNAVRVLRGALEPMHKVETARVAVDAMLRELRTEPETEERMNWLGHCEISANLYDLAIAEAGYSGEQNADAKATWARDAALERNRYRALLEAIVDAPLTVEVDPSLANAIEAARRALEGKS